ncbi:hypothetical protein [Salinarimonas rosea]|uniref:hypothetical protein n=1 Tax=Salinarimonas rosea TaxID=552063 RepID=UPI0003FD9344|nr:hypothetical protein [Salinarimonas rosea]
MSEVVVPLSAPPVGLAMDAQAHARIGRLEAAREALRLARTPPPPLPTANPPIPPSFEEALIARALHAAANAPPPPPIPPPPQTPADASIDLWASEGVPAMRGAPTLATAAGTAPAAAVDPRDAWAPPPEAPPSAPVVVDAARLAADPRSVFSAQVIEALRARHLGDVPLRAPERGADRP